MTYRETLNRMPALRGARAVAGWIAFSPKIARDLGSRSAAILLQRMIDWVDGPGVDADGWFSHTADWIEDKTTLTYDEQKVARALLRRRGLLEDRRRGIPAMLHYRLCLLAVDELLQRVGEYRDPPTETKQDQERPPTSSRNAHEQDRGNSTNKIMEHPRSILSSRSSEVDPVVDLPSAPADADAPPIPITPTVPVNGPTPGPSGQVVIDSYHALFTKRTGRPPVIVGGRDGRLAKQLIASHGHVLVLEMLQVYFTTDDPWIQEQSGHTFPIFYSQFNKLLDMRATAAARRISTPRTRGNLAAIERFRSDIAAEHEARVAAQESGG